MLAEYRPILRLFIVPYTRSTLALGRHISRSVDILDRYSENVEFYNQGKIRLAKTNLTRDITDQPLLRFKLLAQAFMCSSLLD